MPRIKGLKTGPHAQRAGGRTEQEARRIGRALIASLPVRMTQQQVAEALGMRHRAVARIEELAVYKMFEAAERLCKAEGVEGVRVPS